MRWRTVPIGTEALAIASIFGSARSREEGSGPVRRSRRHDRGSGAGRITSDRAAPRTATIYAMGRGVLTGTECVVSNGEIDLNFG